MFLYKKDGTGYFLYNTKIGNIISRMDKIAIAFSKDSEGLLILHKHGNLANVEKWLNQTRNKYKLTGFKNIAGELGMVVGKFPIDEINHCLQTSGYLKRMLEKLDIKI